MALYNPLTGISRRAYLKDIPSFFGRRSGARSAEGSFLGFHPFLPRSLVESTQLRTILRQRACLLA